MLAKCSIKSSSTYFKGTVLFCITKRRRKQERHMADKIGNKEEKEPHSKSKNKEQMFVD